MSLGPDDEVICPLGDEEVNLEEFDVMQSKIARIELLIVSSESLPEEQSDGGGISSSRLVPQAYCLSTLREIGDLMTKLPVNGKCS